VTTRRAVRGTALILFIGLVFAFFVYSLLSAWHKTGGELPSIGRLALAGCLILLGLFAAAVAWATILGTARRVDHGAAFLVAQLAKYVPGAVFQAAGQVGLSRSVGAGGGQSAVAYTVMALTQAVAGATYAIALAFLGGFGSALTRLLIALGGFAAIALLDRRWMVFALRRIRRTRSTAELLPAQRAIVYAWLASIVTLGAGGGAYAVLLGGFGKLSDPWFVVTAYATAWTVGFVLVPIPSGLGVREAVLAGLLHGTFPTAVLVSASVYLRLISIAVEGLAAAIASHRVRPSRLRRLSDRSLRAQTESDGPAST
jgi:uncharacterized membrane protein YbhN (UPF0104 family)